MIEVKNLKKYYELGGETVKALDGINLTIKQGEMIAVIGPSGSGKSTLMHLIGGLDKPDSGEIIVDGINLSDKNGKQLAEYRNKFIGFVFQTFNLQTHLTSLENVELPLIFSGLNKKVRREKALKALEKVGLLDRLKHRPGELSGGQRQRVSIARALVNSPKVIFADEPTGNLDSKTGDIILQLLKDLNEKDNVTIIIVTHDNYVAKATGRIIQIHDGKIHENNIDKQLIEE